MDHNLRRSLIEALKNRRWTHLDAERAADSLAAFYQPTGGAWQVWHSQAADDPDYYRVALRENDVSVYKSLFEGRVRDVANALNEIEAHDSDATGTH